MPTKILITGGAGFVGSHLADELLRYGYHVRVLDNLTSQVHGPDARRPGYLQDDAELIVGDVRDPGAVSRALDGVDAVFHLAAAVGVGQSMYKIVDYTSVNMDGTAVLLEALSKREIARLVVASSMSIYGEGIYCSPSGALVEGGERSLKQLTSGDWELRDRCGRSLAPLPTPESKRPSLPSVYAISKYHQEQLCLTMGRAYGIPTVALRFFNIFGIRQALSNPYTGVLANFAARFLNHRAPLINEDGRQRRDFVNVRDVAKACRLAMETPDVGGQVFNIGSGHDYSILQIAREMARVLGRETIEPEITGKYRMGDIRNCFADISLAKKRLGYQPEVELQEGLLELAEWLKGQTVVDSIPRAREELAMRGLTV